MATCSSLFPSNRQTGSFGAVLNVLFRSFAGSFAAGEIKEAAACLVLCLSSKSTLSFSAFVHAMTKSF
jgi:hypothetical protein